MEGRPHSQRLRVSLAAGCTAALKAAIFSPHSSQTISQCVPRAGVERLTTLTIYHGRHTYISHALAGGRTLAEVRDAVGHANVSITSSYLHVAVDDDQVGNLIAARTLDRGRLPGENRLRARGTIYERRGRRGYGRMLQDTNGDFVDRPPFDITLTQLLFSGFVYYALILLKISLALSPIVLWVYVNRSRLASRQLSVLGIFSLTAAIALSLFAFSCLF